VPASWEHAQQQLQQPIPQKSATFTDLSTHPIEIQNLKLQHPAQDTSLEVRL
jgi:hypothetical protein